MRMTTQGEKNHLKRHLPSLDHHEASQQWQRRCFHTTPAAPPHSKRVNAVQDVLAWYLSKSHPLEIYLVSSPRLDGQKQHAPTALPIAPPISVSRRTTAVTIATSAWVTLACAIT